MSVKKKKCKRESTKLKTSEESQENVPEWRPEPPGAEYNFSGEA